MKTINAYKAAPIHDEHIESVSLVIDKTLPYNLSTSYNQMIDMHKENAARVYEALKILPQGTMDQLLRMMLESRARALVIPTKD